MNGNDYIWFGLIFAIYTGLMEFVFKNPVNAFGMTIGIIIAGCIIKIIELNNVNKKTNEDE